MQAVRQCNLGVGIQCHLLPLERSLHCSDVTNGHVSDLQFIVEKRDRSSGWGLFLPQCELLTNSMSSSNCEGCKYNQVYLFFLGSWYKIPRLIWSQTRLIFQMFISSPIFLSTCYIVKLPPRNRMFSTAEEPTKLSKYPGHQLSFLNVSENILWGNPSSNPVWNWIYMLGKWAKNILRN